MTFLTTLLGIETPESTALQSAELTFRGLAGWWLAVVVLLALAALVVFLYRQEKGTLGPIRRGVASGLRIALFVLLLLLLFRPVLLAEFAGKRPRGVVLLLDNSRSMTQRDRRLVSADAWRVAIAKGLATLKTDIGDVKNLPAPPETPKDPARAEIVQWVVEHPDLKLIDALRKLGPLRTYLFGHRVRGVSVEGSDKSSPAAGLLASFKADDARTRLADAIQDVLQRKDGDLPSAIVVVSDGQDNASKFTFSEAGLECQRQNVPLHVYGVGSAEAGSLQLKEVAAPDTLFVDDTVTIPLRWRAFGFKKGALVITLSLGGKELGKPKEVHLQVGEDLRDALTITVPKGKDQEENLDLVASIQIKDNPNFKDSMTRQVRVVDRKIKILYIEHAPRFEYKFLQPALLRDRRVEAQFVLVNADPKVAAGGPPFLAKLPATREKFFDAKYNVIILGDVAASYLGRDHQEWIKEFVEKRGGLIVVAGPQHMPATYEKSPLAEVLPVEFTPHKFAVEADVRTQEYPPTLTEIGQRTDMLALADTAEDNLKLWQSLPGFHWHYPAAKLRPGALSLIVNPRAKMGAQPMPILATQFYGQGQVIYLGTAETWRWRFNAQDKHFVRFWGQLIYQLGLPSLLGETSRRAQFALERSAALLDKPGSIFVRLVDKDFHPRKEATIDATLTQLDGKPGREQTQTIKLQAISGRPGEYRALLAHDRPGRFEFKVNNPDAYTFQYNVDKPPGHELEEASLPEKALRDLAQLSGGKFYREEDLHGLAGAIEPRSVTFTRRQEVVLWNPLMFLIFVMLITAEWLVRKFSNLS